jgi:hypothetical protein
MAKAKDGQGQAYNYAWGIGRHLLGSQVSLYLASSSLLSLLAATTTKLLSQVFDYWKDPWGNTVEHWSDGDQLNASSGTNYKNPISMLLGTQWGPTIIGSHL